MKRIYGLFVLLLGFSVIQAQQIASIDTNDNTVFTIVQQRPVFQGDIHQWLSDNIVYPEDAKAANIQGTAYISFIVEKDGSISTVKILRSSGSSSLDKEGVRVISIMPKWAPGRQNGHAVRVSDIVPLHFKLEDTQNTPSPDDKPLTVVQQKPVFSGDINQWMTQHIVYPPDARKNNIQGTVFISFVIEKDGSVSTVKILRGVDELLNNEAVRVVSSMPKWAPGVQDGHAVRVQYMIPIHFILNNTLSR